jgi:hypothetical protein
LSLLTSSETTAVKTTLAPPSFSDDEFQTDTALGPLQISKHFLAYFLSELGYNQQEHRNRN